MKKILAVLLVFVMCFSLFTVANAENEIKVVIDDKNQSYDQMPQILNGRTLVPLRGIFEALGAKVEWVDQTKTIIGSKGSNTVILQVESTSAVMNNKKITLDVAPKIINSRTMVPVRFISEALGAKVDWIDETKTVVITSEERVQEIIRKEQKEKGIVVVDYDSFKKNCKKYENGFAKIELKDDVFVIDVTKLPEKDLQVTLNLLTPLEAIINKGDVCILNFKARLVSGGDNGSGYIKAWVQGANSEKALFARSDVKSEWTECNMPFVGIEKMTNMGFRFGGALQSLELKDIEIVNYGPEKDVTTLPSTVIDDGNTVAPGISAEVKKEPVQETPKSEIKVDGLPEGGVVVVDSVEFTKNIKHYENGFAKIGFDSDVLKVDVHTLPDKDLKVYSTVQKDISSLISADDICIMTFEARLISGGDANGIGYIKPWVQGKSNAKALFARTNVGKEWTRCYLPFTGIAELKDAGMRFGGAVQTLEIRNFRIINYKNAVELSKLPTTEMK